MSRTAEISRRAVVGALAAAGLGFAAFGPSGGKRRYDGRLVLDYWEKWTGDEGRAMQRIVDSFNESQDKIFVRYLVTNSIHQKALVSILGGSPPDILGLYAYNVPSYSEANAVLPLGDLAAQHGLTLEHYAPGMRPVMTSGGRWYAIINTGGTLALYWNRAIFRENADALTHAGLSAERAPRTIAELDAANRIISRVKGGGAPGNGPLERAGFLHMEPGWWSWIWGYFFGGSLYDPVKDRALAGSEEFIRAYEWVQSYPKEFGSEHVDRFRSGFGPYGTPQSAFLTGEVAMVVQGPWMANQVVAFRPDLDYGVAPMPVVDSMLDPQNPVTCVDTDVLMIPRGAKHPEASMEFIAYTQRKENVEALATAHCKGSPLAEVSESFLANHPNRGVRLFTSMASSSRAFIAPPTPVWPEFKDIFDTAMQDLWTLREPARDRLPRVQTRAQALLDDAAALRRKRGESRPGGAA